jgi:ABC-type nitrate/sulfonate/bicarbonate transport system substrate-binding protein
VLVVAPAGAAEKLRVVKAVAFAWTFTPLDVGIEMGLFAKHGLDVEASAAAGDAKLQQALTADSADIGIGSGPGMAFMAKGVPAKAVGVMYGVPKNMAVMVAYNSPIKTVDDLKGKKIGCTTVGSLTHWIGDRINHVKGWGPSGITMVPIGGDEDQSDRWLYRRAGVRVRAGGAEGMARHHQRHPVRRTFHHARFLRAR